MMTFVITASRPPEAIYQLDDDWARDVRAPRWKTRAASPIEWAHANRFSDESTGCHGCVVCAPHVLVIASPSRRHRLRYGFAYADIFSQRPDDILPRWFVWLMISPDDATWLDRVGAFLGQPAGDRR